jgi:SAM-dependent methyltransferase
MNLDLGCGLDVCDPIYVGADLLGKLDWKEAQPGEIAYVDLRSFPWPWADDSVELVWCAHYIQYQTSLEWINFVDELYRILQPDGQARLVWPNLRTGRAWQDPLFQDHIPLERWSYASKSWRERHAGPDPTGSYPKCDLEIMEFGWEGLHDDFHTRSEDTKQYASSHYWDMAADCTLTIKAVK